MGRPRIHKDDAAKAKAYRERKKKAEAAEGRAYAAANQAIVHRVMAADAKARD